MATHGFTWHDNSLSLSPISLSSFVPFPLLYLCISITSWSFFFVWSIFHTLMSSLLSADRFSLSGFLLLSESLPALLFRLSTGYSVPPPALCLTRKSRVEKSEEWCRFGKLNLWFTKKGDRKKHWVRSDGEGDQSRWLGLKRDLEIRKISRNWSWTAEQSRITRPKDRGKKIQIEQTFHHLFDYSLTHHSCGFQKSRQELSCHVFYDRLPRRKGDKGKVKKAGQKGKAIREYTTIFFSLNDSGGRKGTGETEKFVCVCVCVFSSPNARFSSFLFSLILFQSLHTLATPGTATQFSQSFSNDHRERS